MSLGQAHPVLTAVPVKDHLLSELFVVLVLVLLWERMYTACSLFI